MQYKIISNQVLICNIKRNQVPVKTQSGPCPAMAVEALYRAAPTVAGRGGACQDGAGRRLPGRRWPSLARAARRRGEGCGDWVGRGRGGRPMSGASSAWSEARGRGEGCGDGASPDVAAARGQRRGRHPEPGAREISPVQRRSAKRGRRATAQA
jgi:hypothetical protein